MFFVMLVKSPIQMSRSELADADHSHSVKGICESSADYSEPPPFRQPQPGGTSHSVNEHTGLKRTADRDGPNTSNTASMPCETISPQCTGQEDENTTLQQPSAEDALSAATTESVLPAERSGSDNTERDENTAAEEPSAEECPVHMDTSETVDADCLNLAKEMHQALAENSEPLTPGESMFFVTPVKKPIHINTSELADADDLNIVKAIPESLDDYSKQPPFRQRQPGETSHSVSEHTALTSATEEVDGNAGNTVLKPCEAVLPHCTEQRDEHTTAQQPPVENAFNTATTVEPVLLTESLESDNTECLERAEYVLQDDVESMTPVYFETTRSLALESVDENMHSISPVASSCENLSEITDIARGESSVSSNPQCPERTENVFQEDVVSVTQEDSGTYAAERFISELTEENVDSTTPASSSCVENLSEVTETAAAPQTLQTDVSPALSPAACPEPGNF